MFNNDEFLHELSKDDISSNCLKSLSDSSINILIISGYVNLVESKLKLLLYRDNHIKANDYLDIKPDIKVSIGILGKKYRNSISADEIEKLNLFAETRNQILHGNFIKANKILKDEGIKIKGFCLNFSDGSIEDYSDIKSHQHLFGHYITLSTSKESLIYIINLSRNCINIINKILSISD
jgi:hypothetical protein